jgi:hypothetical protein
MDVNLADERKTFALWDARSRIKQVTYCHKTRTKPSPSLNGEESATTCALKDRAELANLEG